jgi:muramoyltetrapeptide carboxypeptidase LdcA involved in peptidoglycan recycling
MRKFVELNKLKKGDSVAILSPSYAAPATWPHVYKLGLKRLKEEFGLHPVEFPTTAKLKASTAERAIDLIAAFKSPEIKGIITTLGGDDQITYIKNLPKDVFIDNPKPFYGFSDNTHFANFLWLNGIPSYYGAGLFTQFAMPGKIDDFTKKYLEIGLFKSGEIKIDSSPLHSEYSFTDWSRPETLTVERDFIENFGWTWEGEISTEGVTWGGCLESIDELLRHGVEIPTLKEFEEIVLILETCEEVPSPEYVARVIRAFGEKGFLTNIKGVLVGRPDAGSIDSTKNYDWRQQYRVIQQETILKMVRTYNKQCPVVQNLDFGHTHPQICLSLGRKITINSAKRSIAVEF